MEIEPGMLTIKPSQCRSSAQKLVEDALPMQIEMSGGECHQAIKSMIKRSSTGMKQRERVDGHEIWEGNCTKTGA
jgi:hypothetical protein